MNHENELWQEYQQNGEPLMDGGRPTRTADPNYEEKAPYGITLVWLYRKTATGLEFLFQKRSKFVDRNAGKWDISAGGHINYGEKIVEAAARETIEEIGAKTEVEKLEYGFSMNNQTRICHTFFYDWTGKDDDFAFNDQEVEEVKWIKLEDIDAFRKTDVKSVLAKDNLYFDLFYNWVGIHNGLKENIYGNSKTI